MHARVPEFDPRFVEEIDRGLYRPHGFGPGGDRFYTITEREVRGRNGSVMDLEALEQ